MSHGRWTAVAGRASARALLASSACAARRHPGLAVFAVLAALGLGYGLELPWTDDARFYVPAAEAYARWLERAVAGLFTLDFSAWSRPAIDAAFSVNREHPPAGKYAMGLGWLVLHDVLGIASPITACRVPVVLLWAWSGALVLRLLWGRVSPAAGIFGAFAFATLPRVFFHGHAETLDLPVAAFILASAEAFLRSLESPRPRTAVAATLYFALALGTKHNAAFALVGFVVFWLAWAPPRRDGALLRLAPVPWALAGMSLLAPLLVCGLWPWLWSDTVARLGAYLRFHLAHYPIRFYFGGVAYGDDLAPWHAPWVMAAITVPLPVLVLALAGAGRPLAWLTGLRASSRVAARLHLGRALGEEPALALGVLALLVALVQVGSLSLPGVPVYAGAKLFLPAFPFVAVLAALGFHAIERELGGALPAARVRAGALVAVGALLVAPGVAGLASHRSAPLSYYGELAGGLRGATRAGFERQYYDLAYPELAQALARALGESGTFAVLPNPKEYGPHLARWHEQAVLAPGVRLTSPERADVLVLTHERRWPSYPEIAARYRQRPVLARHALAGVPLFTLYDLRPMRERRP